jgi:hypothetical protein
LSRNLNKKAYNFSKMKKYRLIGMGKKSLAAVIVVATVACLVVTLVLYSQLSTLKTQNDMLTEQNMMLQTQNSTLQAQLKEQQLQNCEQQDRLNDYTAQLAHARSLKVEITDARASRGWYPLGGVTGTYPANATIANRDVVPLYGLKVSFRFFDPSTNSLVGYEHSVSFDIAAGETKEVVGSALANIDTNMDGLVCRITVYAGDVILDTWTQQLS